MGKTSTFHKLSIWIQKAAFNKFSLKYLNEIILEERENNNSVCGVFLDFAKAFDCVNHQILINKLEHYGIRGNALKLLCSYLTNRLQYTSNDLAQVSSEHQTITTGVPQGSVLGPFLFLVYINDLPNCCNSKMLLYADDSTLLCAETNISTLKSKIENEICKIENWIRLNKLTLNYNKTNCILFSHNKCDAQNNFCINSSNGPISIRSSVKYLGVMIDHKLSWKFHTKFVAEKLCMARGILCKLRHCAPQAVLKSIYYSIAYPYIQYGITSWGNAASKYLQKVQVQQNYILKIVTNTLFFKTKSLPLYSQLKLLKVHNVYSLEVLKFVYKYKKKILPKCFDKYYLPASQIHDYSTRFALDHNWAAAPLFHKNITQRSIKFEGYKIWNNLPDEIKNKFYLSFDNFFKKVKVYLSYKQSVDA